jgi:ribosomal protein L37AE/L43A
MSDKAKNKRLEKFQITCRECGQAYWCPVCGSTYFIKSSLGITMCRSCWHLIRNGLNIKHDLNKHKVYRCSECRLEFYSEISLWNHEWEEHYK